MRTIGLLGGMSWESTATYYRLLNEGVRDRTSGSLHSADCLLRSVDFAEIVALQRAGDWDEAGALLADEARMLQEAGAELIVLCTNTMHVCAAQIEAAIRVPFLHIGDATGEGVRAAGVRTVGLLATAYTMEQPFLIEYLRERHGIEVLVPDASQRAEVHRVIFEELCLGRATDASRDFYRSVMARLADRGAEGILLACTEIDLLVGPSDAAVPVLDTTRLHVEAALDQAGAGSLIAAI